jgi:protein TonB
MTEAAITSHDPRTPFSLPLTRKISLACWGVVIGVHLAVFYLLIWMSNTPHVIETPALMVELIESVNQQAAPEPVVQPQEQPRPKTRKPAIAAPAPVLAAETPVATKTETLLSPEPVQEPVAQPSPPAVAATASSANSTASKNSAITGAQIDKRICLHYPEPVRPRISHRLGEKGEVVLRLVIDNSGQATKVDLLNGSGYTRLDQAAIDAAWSWRKCTPSPDGVSVKLIFL